MILQKLQKLKEIMNSREMMRENLRRSQEEMKAKLQKKP